MKISHLVNFKTSGTILAATKFTINKILSFIPFEQNLTILEIGLGDGCISNEIISKMTTDSKFIGIELNKEFYSDLKSKIIDPRVYLLNDNVLNLSSSLQRINITKIDVIVSTLPLSFFDKLELDSIFSQILSHMNENSTFIQAVHMPNISDLLNNHFRDIQSSIELRNLPPYIIYVCKK